MFYRLEPVQQASLTLKDVLILIIMECFTDNQVIIV